VLLTASKRAVTLPLAIAALLIIVASGSCKRVERAALIVGAFDLAFFVVAWAAHPGSRRWLGTRSICRWETAIFCSWARRSSARLSTLDDLLPAVRDGGEEAARERSRPRAMGDRGSARF
jgi:hypothetical protein